LIATLTTLVVLIARLAANPAVLPPLESATYWAAVRLDLQGENPYDPERVLALEREAGRDESHPVIMYGPPATMTLFMPFGLLPSRAAQFAWLLFHLVVVVVFCADRLWRLYGGPTAYRGLAWIIAASFVPTLILLWAGQIASMVLLGIVGFLYFARQGRWWLAGAAVALTTLKPHLVYLFWAALILWTIQRRRWAVLLGCGLALLAATAVPILFNPLLLQQYRQALADHPPTDWVTPTLGAALRFGFGEDKAWLQFLPTLFGLLWFVFYWAARRRTWQWAQQAPVLIFVSFLTTFYAWSHDLVVLLVPVLQAAVVCLLSRRRWMAYFAFGAYLIVNGIAFAGCLSAHSDFWLIWVAPMLMLAYFMIFHWAAKHESVRPAPQ
jgi:hypothetical protein